jgi:molybdopterin converting factor subunit 1
VLVKVRLFARLRELAGAAELTRDVAAPATVRDVWDGLAGDVAGLAAYASTVSCAVNEEYARFTTAVHDGDEVAFLPPVSGGSAV